MVAEDRPWYRSGGRAGRAWIEGERQPLARRHRRGEAAARRRLDARDLPVVVRRIVVVEDELADAGRLGQARALLRRRVAPAAHVRVLLDGVLRVVDEDVGAARELDEPTVEAPRRVVLGGGGVD